MSEIKLPFENFPELVKSIEWFANNVRCPGTEWNKLLREINNALSAPNTGKPEEKLIYPLSSKGFEDMLEDFTIDHLKDSGYSVGSEEASDITYAEKNRRIIAATDIILNGLPLSANTGKGGELPDNVKKLIEDAANKEEIYPRKYGSGTRDGYSTMMLYEINSERSECFEKGAIFGYNLASPETSLLNTGKADEDEG